MGSTVFEMLQHSKYESGVVGARRRLLFTLKMQLFCTLASPSTPVYGMKSWIDLRLRLVGHFLNVNDNHSGMGIGKNHLTKLTRQNQLGIT